MDEKMSWKNIAYAVYGRALTPNPDFLTRMWWWLNPLIPPLSRVAGMTCRAMANELLHGPEREVQVLPLGFQPVAIQSGSTAVITSEPLSVAFRPTRLLMNVTEPVGGSVMDGAGKKLLVIVAIGVQPALAGNGSMSYPISAYENFRGPAGGPGNIVTLTVTNRHSEAIHIEPCMMGEVLA